MGSKFHALMFPWFATGHMTPFLHLANNLAAKGHRVTYILPNKALKQLEHLNLFPDNIVLHSVTVPHVDGLPVGAETASDIPGTRHSLLAAAIDLIRDQVEDVVRTVGPDVIFFDFSHWIPEVAREFGVKSVMYSTSAATTMAIMLPGSEPGVPPPGYPSSKVLIRKQDLYAMKPVIEIGVNFFERVITGFMNSDYIAIRTVAEIEGKFCDFIEKQCKKKVLLTGPMFSKPDKSIQLEEQWSTWLSGFEPNSVVYCAFGTEVILEKDQFKELCLGMELTGLPFLVVVKSPKGSSTIQEALPEGFEEGVKGRGIVWGGWVQQPFILSHSSVGCFVSHCGFGSMWESLVNDCQIVLRYLAGTPMQGLLIRADSPMTLHDYSHVDWAGDTTDFVSTSAYIVYLGRTPISWSSKKQKGVARSWSGCTHGLRGTLDLFFAHRIAHYLPSTLVIYCDNIGATYLCANPVFHSRMKHIALDYHFVRDNIGSGALRVTHVSTHDQLADALTKPLPRQRFQDLSAHIGVTSVSPS